MAELPWFPMYARDWLAGEGTSMMLPEQEGAFIRLLCVAWGDGASEPSLPDDDRALAQISRLGSRWKRLGPLVRAQFAARDGRLYNGKLSSVWGEQQERSRRLAENGQKGGRAKAGLKPGHSAATATLEQDASKTLAKPCHTEAEAEAEFYQSISPPLAEGEADLAAWLATDEDRTALTIVLAKARSRAGCLASLNGMRQGLDVKRAPTREEMGGALRDYSANGADWNAAHFRGYLNRRALGENRAESPAKSSSTKGEAALLLGKIKSLVQVRQQPGQAVQKSIPIRDVEALGPRALAAYKAVGGSGAVVDAEGERYSFLLRDFTQAYEAARDVAAA